MGFIRLKKRIYVHDHVFSKHVMKLSKKTDRGASLFFSRRECKNYILHTIDQPDIVSMDGDQRRFHLYTRFEGAVGFKGRRVFYIVKVVTNSTKRRIITAYPNGTMPKKP